MCMMTSIFGDQNFLSLLCYLDILVFAPDESTASERLEMVFQRLRGHNLKLSPKKCHLLQRGGKFLGHIINKEGVSTDPDTVVVLSELSKDDLMEADSVTPSKECIRSFLGMLNYNQHFIKAHTLRISHTLTGHERVVQRNLLLLVNFLPIQSDHADSFPGPTVPIKASAASSDCNSEMCELHTQVGIHSAQGHVPAVHSGYSCITACTDATIWY